jgi:endonuclease III
MNEKKKAKIIIKTLNKIYPKILTPLKSRNTFTLLISVLLSAQCTDLNVNNVTKNIYKKYYKPEHFVKLGRKKIEKLIKKIGIFRIKAKNIFLMSKQVLEKHNGKVPQTFEELEKLPGVGHKTASVVMSQGFGYPAFAVDTHIHRLAQRWGLTSGKNVLQTEKDLKRIFPKKIWSKLHLQIIFYGREYCKARNCYGLSCKICTTCYPNRKKPVITQKHSMKILGIGNAIVDVICKVNDSFIEQNNLTKSTMKLFFDQNEFRSLFTNLKIEKTISGGSVANSIVGLSQLGNKVGFIGKISDDEFGSKYEEGLKKENVEYFYSKKREVLPTGTCLILVTPDSERTMCTFLGTAGKINEKDVDVDVIKKSELIFLEGYLWDEGDPKKAFDKAINSAKKVAMSLSDQFCVDRHKPHFLNLVKKKLDIIFANEQEIKSLIDAKNFNEVINFSKNINKLIIITRGEKGAIAIQNEEVFEANIVKDLKILDLTGAGDLFASGFLHGYINKLSIKESLQKGTIMSAKIIQQIGARL